MLAHVFLITDNMVETLIKEKKQNKTKQAKTKTKNKQTINNGDHTKPEQSISLAHQYSVI